MTPILVSDGTFEKKRILATFEDKAKAIDPEIMRFVINAIRKYPLFKG